VSLCLDVHKVSPLLYNVANDIVSAECCCLSAASRHDSQGKRQPTADVQAHCMNAASV